MHAVMARESPSSSRSQLSVWISSDLFRRFKAVARTTGKGHQQTLVAIALERLLSSWDTREMRDAVADYEAAEMDRSEENEEEESKPAHPAQEPRSPAERGSRLSPRRA